VPRPAGPCVAPTRDCSPYATLPYQSERRLAFRCRAVPHRALPQPSSPYQSEPCVPHGTVNVRCRFRANGQPDQTPPSLAPPLHARPYLHARQNHARQSYSETRRTPSQASPCRSITCGTDRNLTLRLPARPLAHTDLQGLTFPRHDRPCAPAERGRQQESNLSAGAKQPAHPPYRCRPRPARTAIRHNAEA
jgi:hypothetical protein